MNCIGGAKWLGDRVLRLEKERSLVRDSLLCH